MFNSKLPLPVCYGGDDGEVPVNGHGHEVENGAGGSHVVQTQPGSAYLERNTTTKGQTKGQLKGDQGQKVTKVRRPRCENMEIFWAKKPTLMSGHS